MNNEQKRQQLEHLTQETIMATREERLSWEESSQPNAFRASIASEESTDLMQLEMLREQNTGSIRLAIRHNDQLVATFHSERQKELQELMEHLQDDTDREDGRIEQTLEGLRKLRSGESQPRETTATKRKWSVERTINGLDEDEEEDIQLDVEIHFSDHQGATVDWTFWETALDFFLQYDDLNQFVQDSGHWHSRDDFLLTGTTFQSDLQSMDLEAPDLMLDGEAIRYTANEMPGGSLFTHTQEDCVVSRVKFQMRFRNRDTARPVLAYLSKTFG